MLIETIPAAFEMEEMRHELGDHAAALNAGRWDYLFSVSRVFSERALVRVRADEIREAGDGAAGIHALMEDAATAKISRSQVWQWINAGVELDTGETVTEELVRRVIDEEVAAIGGLNHVDRARALFQQVALADEFPDFLTLPAYSMID